MTPSNFIATNRNHVWASIGSNVSNVHTATEAMHEAGLAGWNVRKTPLYWQTEATIDENGVTPPQSIEVPDRFGIIRTNPNTGHPEHLGTVGTQYQPIQNEQTATLLDAIVGESGGHFQYAGAMRGGRDVFFTIKLPDEYSVVTPDGVTDAYDLNVVALNSHDGGGAFRVMVTPIRLACMNQQRAAKKSAVSNVSIRHTRNAQNAIDEVQRALGLVRRQAEVIREDLQTLADTPMDYDESVEFFTRLTKVNEDGISSQAKANRRRAAFALQSNLDGTRTLTDAMRRTRYGAYQAVTEYVDHLAPAKGGQTVRALRVASGSDTIKATAFDLLLAN